MNHRLLRKQLGLLRITRRLLSHVKIRWAVPSPSLLIFFLISLINI